MALDRRRELHLAHKMAGKRRGFVIWLTGLPGAGKTTLATHLLPELHRRAFLTYHLDGDLVRASQIPKPGYSKAERDANVIRIARCAAQESRAGAAVVVSAISPYDATRRAARALIERHVPFIEIHVATSLEECVRRDPKGQYARAFSGDIPSFTGVSAPYEEPSQPAMRLDTRGATPDESVGTIVAHLEMFGFLAPANR